MVPRHSHAVVAVEPCAEMRALAELRTPAGVQWLDDSLPGLEATYRLGLKYDIILVSAVWKHLAPGDRHRAIRKLAGLLRPGGFLVIGFRTTPFDDDRTFHPTNAEELRAQARAQMLAIVGETTSGDFLGRRSGTLCGLTPAGLSRRW